ncbi:MAG: tRNA preQ1(34) S-adenosylmethionine ribosyltransferase-isomerase QueA [Acidiferrobacterales bacterium]
MRKSDFQFTLPKALIAQEPPAQRGATRLLHLDRASGLVQDRVFGDLPQLLQPGDLLVINDTRVIPARLHGIKDSGGRIELLVERVLDERRFLAQCRSSKPPKPGQQLKLDGATALRVVERRAEFYELEMDTAGTVAQMLERIGHVPLPPYIDRPDEARDRERYQTVYARQPGAVAAPTAGLHFDLSMLERLRAIDVQTVSVTLHVGSGTFQPMRVDDIREHRMHAEHIEIGVEAAQTINSARAAGRRIIAVGTTVVRTLESAAESGIITSCSCETGIFIYPGYRFRVIDGLITNFHLPESTLLMLVCAFAGTGPVLAAYRHAVAQGYRFFSYGDAMLIVPGA